MQKSSKSAAKCRPQLQQPRQLDSLDCKILYELDLDARISTSEIARRLRKSKETVNFRLRRLVEEGVLSGFYTIFDTRKLGQYSYKLYLKFKSITPGKEREIYEYLQRQRNIIYLASMEGYYDCVVVVLLRTTTDFTSFLYPFMQSYGQHVLEKEMVVFVCTHRLNQRFLHLGPEQADRHHSKQIGSYRLGENELKICSVISSNGRLSALEIARRTGLEPPKVQYAIKKLKRDGIILGHAVSLNYDRLGLTFFQVNISLVDPSVIGAIINYFSSTNKCLFAIEIVGRYDLIIELILENSKQLLVIIDAFREKFYGKYYDYDVSTITTEFLVLWTPVYADLQANLPWKADSRSVRKELKAQA